MARLLRMLVILSAFCLISLRVCAQTGKPPLIIIPGITGSELVDRETGKTLWFSFRLSRGEPDDLRLPMSSNPSANRDNVVAKDIIRDIRLPGALHVFPDIHVYDEALKALAAAGYSEATWENPKASDCFYVFPYDWRRDNVETAHLLIQKIEAAKAKLNRPDIKFDILAHSMGGLVARYAAMYGKADLPVGSHAPVPTGEGARHIGKLLLFGTPSEGSFSAFVTLIHGYRVGGRVLSIDDMTEADVFTIPSLYQLLPYSASVQVLDENLKPVSVNLYDPATWRKYNWGAIGSQKFLAKLKAADQTKGTEPATDAKTIDDKIHAETTLEQANAFLGLMLSRAQKFHQALSVKTAKPLVETIVYGGNCEQTLSAIVLVRDVKKDRWETMVSPREIRTSSGRKISDEQVKAAIYADGDGRVTERSLLAATTSGTVKRFESGPGVKSSYFACVSHPKLLNSRELQAQFLPVLNGRQK